jgi:hypothetical protein
MISFITTCKGRRHHVEDTLPRLLQMEFGSALPSGNSLVSTCRLDLAIKSLGN